MKANRVNPSNNKLPPGIDERGFLEGVSKSGYPLQSLVAQKLIGANFEVFEEWPFTDRITGTARTLDIVAMPRLFVRATVNPRVCLLIECKRSVNPVVFFRMTGRQALPWFPRITGLSRPKITIHAGFTKPSHRDFFPASVLGLSDVPFAKNVFEHSVTFAKAIPKGKNVELDGSNTFNDIVHPLISACEHAGQEYSFREDDKSIAPTMILCMAVLDAPMVLIEAPVQGLDPILTPWIRVVRHEPIRTGRGFESRSYALDIVHAGFLNTLIKKHLVPSVHEYFQRASILAPVLSAGEGRVAHTRIWGWEDLQPRKSADPIIEFQK
jgi:hypothetical protein